MTFVTGEKNPNLVILLLEIWNFANCGNDCEICFWKELVDHLAVSRVWGGFYQYGCSLEVSWLIKSFRSHAMGLELHPRDYQLCGLWKILFCLEELFTPRLQYTVSRGPTLSLKCLVHLSFLLCRCLLLEGRTSLVRASLWLPSALALSSLYFCFWASFHVCSLSLFCFSAVWKYFVLLWRRVHFSPGFMFLPVSFLLPLLIW